MAVHKLQRVQDDTGEPVNFTVTLDNQVLNLTGYTVDFIMKAPDATLINTGHTACTVTNAAAGQCTYAFQTGDLAQVGLYTCDLQTTSGAGVIVTEFAQYEITVRAQNG